MSRFLAIFATLFAAITHGAEPVDSREHWAFRPPAINRSIASVHRFQSTPQQLTNEPASSKRNVIDAILDGRRRERGLVANPPAPKPIWLRRVYLDLIGLPPSLEEIRAFELDPSPNAREIVVDRLLARPQYGERWARHFMDIWRYCDWWGLGDQLRYSQKHIWHWRDWIVESLNSDKGYDQMVIEQLAGDELAPGDPDVLRATGFLARNYYLFNRTTWLEDVVEHTGKAFLGLTLNCAKCHDHKYDPIAQTDYYAWRAIFEPYHARLDELPGETDLEKDGLPRAYDLHLDRPTYLQIKGDPNNLDISNVIAPAIPTVLAFDPLAIQPVSLPPHAQEPALQSWVIANHLEAARKEIAAAREHVTLARNALKKARAAVPLPSVGTAARESTPAAASLSQKLKPTITKSPSENLGSQREEAVTSRDRLGEVSPGTLVPTEGEVPQTSPSKNHGVGATPKSESALELAQLAVEVAEKALAAAELRPPLLKAVMASDVARYGVPPAPTDTDALARKAAQAEATFQLAEAEANCAKTKLDHLNADLKQAKDAEKKLIAAEEALAKARERNAAPSTNYTSLRGSLKALEGPDETETNRVKPYPSTSSGRRLALARWIVDRRNPLTARVLVNHVWTRHFGQALVPSLTDFGLRAPAPVYQDLLDWLAVDFMEHGWDLKRLHRQLLLSETYAMSSSANGIEDSENVFYQRMNTQRLDAQTLRDSLLQLAGTLDLQLGGPTVNPEKDDTALRRSLYFKQSPEDLHKFLETFDNANPKECYRRAETVLPQQALALANSKLTSDAAARISRRLTSRPEADSDTGFIQTAFEAILAEKPSPSESAACAASLNELISVARDLKIVEPELRARTGLVQALLNHNDFITVR